MYWIPSYKYQLLQWFKKNRSTWRISKLNKKSKKELYAIYLKERNSYEQERSINEIKQTIKER